MKAIINKIYHLYYKIVVAIVIHNVSRKNGIDKSSYLQIKSILRHDCIAILNNKNPFLTNRLALTNAVLKWARYQSILENDIENKYFIFPSIKNNLLDLINIDNELQITFSCFSQEERDAGNALNMITELAYEWFSSFSFLTYVIIFK